MTVQLKTSDGGRAPDAVWEHDALLVDLVAALDAAGSCAEFGQAALLTAQLIDCTSVTFDAVDREGRSLLCCSTDPRRAEPGAVTARLRWVQEHPAIAPGSDPPAAPTAISDVVSREDFQATGLYGESHRGAGVEDELIVGFAGASGPSMLTLARDTWGFTPCEHALAAEIQRILLVMAGVRRDREAVHVGVRVTRGLSDDLGRLVLVADSSGALRGIDGGAADLGEPLTGAVTSAVAVAAATPRGDDPDVPLIEMTVPSARGRQLTVRVLPPPDGSQLFPVVIERPPAGVRHEDLRGHGLTARQAEVMGLILNGSTNGGVAHTLGISERTVEKHVLGAYAKLGARTRTEALLKVLR